MTAWSVWPRSLVEGSFSSQNFRVNAAHISASATSRFHSLWLACLNCRSLTPIISLAHTWIIYRSILLSLAFASVSSPHCMQSRPQRNRNATVSICLSDSLSVLAWANNSKPSAAGLRPMWARGRCRISPPRFLAECCKRQLNQVSFVLLYFFVYFFWFVLSLFICIFLYCIVCQYQSSDWLWRPPPKWPILCRVGR